MENDALNNSPSSSIHPDFSPPCPPSPSPPFSPPIFAFFSPSPLSLSSFFLFEFLIRCHFSLPFSRFFLLVICLFLSSSCLILSLRIFSSCLLSFLRGRVVKWNLAKPRWFAKLFRKRQTPQLKFQTRHGQPTPPQKLCEDSGQNMFFGCSVCPHRKQLIVFAVKWQRPFLDQQQAELRFKNPCFQGSLSQCFRDHTDQIQMTIWGELIEQMIWEGIDQNNEANSRFREPMMDKTNKHWDVIFSHLQCFLNTMQHFIANDETIFADPMGKRTSPWGRDGTFSWISASQISSRFGIDCVICRML